MPAKRIDRRYERLLAGLINSGERGVLLGGLKGVEKESLRVTPDGQISKRPHPRALGSALTHDHVTTDYSEALIELVTPTFTTSFTTRGTCITLLYLNSFMSAGTTVS